MTQEEAIGEITYLVYSNQETMGSAKLQDALRVITESTRNPVPDPDTGLMPCGCGGKAGFHYSVMLQDNDCYVACGICGEHSKVALCEEKARDAWNTAMGWREKE